MPTIVTHALIPLIGAAAFPQVELPKRLVAAGMVAAILPDLDVVSRNFGIHHTHDFGHRGATHTMMFALLVAALGAIQSKALRTDRRTAFLFLFLSTLSHPLTDMLTDGGKGIMLFWPLLDDRLKWAVQPVEVSPIGLRGLEDGRIWSVLASEMLWILLPMLLLVLIVRSFVQNGGRRKSG